MCIIPNDKNEPMLRSNAIATYCYQSKYDKWRRLPIFQNPDPFLSLANIISLPELTPASLGVD